MTLWPPPPRAGITGVYHYPWLLIQFKITTLHFKENVVFLGTIKWEISPKESTEGFLSFTVIYFLTHQEMAAGDSPLNGCDILG